MANKRKTGTREWAQTTVNVQLGCEHGCRYCYARYRAVNRFKLCTAKQWIEPVIVRSKMKKSFSKRSGVVMFPSTHDITPRNLSECIYVLRKLMAAGNKVLLVSKPHIECIREICKFFPQKYRSRLMFRFTIGSRNDRVLSFWEPNAPGFKERFDCLMHVYGCGHRTSVSCEPFLDCKVYEIAELFAELKPYITDSFWIGKLRDFDRRVDMAGVTPGEVERFVRPLRIAQSDDKIWAIYNRLRNEPLVRWKDSFREIIGK